MQHSCCASDAQKHLKLPRLPSSMQWLPSQPPRFVVSSLACSMSASSEMSYVSSLTYGLFNRQLHVSHVPPVLAVPVEDVAADWRYGIGS